MSDFLKIFWLWIPWAFGVFCIVVFAYDRIESEYRKRKIEKGYDIKK